MLVASSMQVYASLLSTNAREQWEKRFEEAYIQPVLSVSAGEGEVVRKRDLHTRTHTQELEKQMGEAMQLILNDKTEGRLTDLLTDLSSLSLLSFYLYRSRSTVLHSI